MLKKNICDYTINNNYSLAILKKNVKNFMRNYEWDFSRYGNNRLVS